MDTVSIELTDDLTLGALRGIAQNLGKQLVIRFEAGGRPAASAPTKVAAVPAAAAPAAGGEKPRLRRKLSPEARAALGRNLAKARAVQAANRAAAAKAAKFKATRPPRKAAKKPA